MRNLFHGLEAPFRGPPRPAEPVLTTGFPANVIRGSLPLQDGFSHQSYGERSRAFPCAGVAAASGHPGFNWKTLSAMAGVTWWNFYCRLYPGTIRSPQVIEFLTHLLRLRESLLHSKI